MAESAAILNPDKRVFVPSLDAGCALSDTITAEDLRDWKQKHPDVGVVAYINTSADVKAEADIICTSSNAAAAARALPHAQILMVPDKNLANYTQKLVPEKRIIPWEGFCPIHHHLSREQVEQTKKEHPNAKIIAHPECPAEIREMADYISSTSNMVKNAAEDTGNEFIVLTECGMANRLKQELPQKKFFTACSLCMDMKKNTLEGILFSLQNDMFEIDVRAEIAEKARQAFQRMFTLGVKPAILPVA